MFSSKAFTACVFVSVAFSFAAIAALAGPATCPADSGEYYHAPPAPLVWALPPHSRTSSAVMMAVKPIKHDAPVEYLFDCVAGDGHDSKWQDSPRYTDSNLKPDTKYSYAVLARDKASQKPIAPGSDPFEVLTRSDGQADTVGHVAKIDKALIAGKLEIIPLMITGPSRNRINIVAINRWTPGSQNPYNKPELREQFIEDARHVLKAFDAADEAAIEPYPQYKNFFNVWAVWWPDMPPYDPEHRKTGMHWDDFNEIRARFFLPWTIPGKGWVTQLAMVNSRSGGGGAGRIIEQRVGDAMIAGNEIKAFIHEFAHTAPGCPDEYTSSGLWGRGGDGLTTTNESRPNFIRWRKWIEPGTPVPTPYSAKYLDKLGLFEGGVHRMAHLFRPTARGCIMGAGSFANDPPGLCPVCRQGSVQRFYMWVQTVEKVTPGQDAITVPGPRTVRFAVARVKPDPDTQKTVWRLNGRVIATGTDEVDVTFGNLPKYELTFAATDETAFIRPDPPFAQFPQAETSWTITNSAARPDDNPLTIELAPRPLIFRGADDGAITVKVAGGTPPYTYEWSDGASLRDRTGLGENNYTLHVTDSEFRTAKADATIQRADYIATTIHSGYADGAWTLTAPSAKDKKDKPVAITWSNGATGPRAEKLLDGTYTCTFRHSSGIEVVRTVTLAKPAEPLAAKVATVVPVTGGENNGAVTIAVSGGRTPYRFEWSDGVECTSPARHFMPAGKYAVTVTDENLTARSLNLTVGDQPLLTVPKLTFARTEGGKVRASGAPAGCKYLWFAEDYPPYLPRFPHGIYTGTFTAPNGRTCQAEAYVIQNKGGLFIDKERAGRNDYGFWIDARAFVKGRDAEPMTVEVQTRSQGKAPRELTVRDQQFGGAAWAGKVADGKLTLQAPGNAGGTFQLLYATRPQQPDKPLCVGDEFAPPEAGNCFVAIQDANTGAISNNRVGVAIALAGPQSPEKPLAPDAAKTAKLLMWLDAGDVDGDGNSDTMPPRRGSIMGWQGKAGGVDFRDFVYYLPNTQNGHGVASWKTIWLQNLGKEVRNYQTIFMVRREHSLSSVGTSPWQGLSKLIGVGEYGKHLMSKDVADDIRGGAVYVNGRKVDPFRTPMPTDFYVATYEFPQQVSSGINRTDGHWEGQVAEVIVFDGKLSPAERAGVEEYLRTKWISAL